MKTPDYVLCEDFELLDENWEKKVLPAGLFVRPIDYYYVPKHIRDKSIHKIYNKQEDVFCYTRIGIIMVPWSKIRRV